MVVSPRSYAVLFPAASASAVHSEIPVTSVHTHSDLCSSPGSHRKRLKLHVLTKIEKDCCFFELARSEFVVSVQRAFRANLL